MSADKYPCIFSRQMETIVSISFDFGKGGQGGVGKERRKDACSQRL